jgi:hypothetical protein
MRNDEVNNPLRVIQESDAAACPCPEGVSEGTVDLTGLFSESVSASGSFDLGDLRLDYIGRLLEALPIPIFLVDPTCHIVFANKGCRRVNPYFESHPAKKFSSVFPDPTSGAKADLLIEQVLSHRMPLISDGVLGTESLQFYGRMHLRSIRTHKRRFVLVMIEEIGLK